MRNQEKIKGITLIALVITIIILLILASITLGFIFGNHGILNMAQKASQASKNSQEEEISNLDKLYSSIMVATNDSSSITVNIEDLKTIIQKEINDTLETKGTNSSPIGNIISQMGKTAPEGYLICDGKEYAISDYPLLAKYFEEQFGKSQYFGGTGDKFKVPDLRGEFLRGSNNNEAIGVHTAEGLPNITGEFGVRGNGAHESYFDITYTNGAFYTTTTSAVQKDAWVNSYNNNLARRGLFNASRSNSIYGNSSHVTPNNRSILYCIKY